MSAGNASLRRSEDPRAFRSVVFTHIPKCGGTSFRSFFYAAALDSAIPPDRVHVPGEGGVHFKTNLPDLSPQGVEKLRARRLSVLANHCRYGSAESYNLGMDAPFYYTVLRDPVARFISHYNFFGAQPKHGGIEGAALNELPESNFRSVVRAYANMQVKYTSGPLGKLTLSRVGIERALDNLRTGYGAFGILERLDVSLELLRATAPRWLRLERAFPFRNPARKSQAPPAEWQIDFIRTCNQLDLEFYTGATAMFEERYRTHQAERARAIASAASPKRAGKV